MTECTCLCRSAPPGLLLAHWQTAGFAEKAPMRMRETVQVRRSFALPLGLRYNVFRAYPFY